MGINYGPPPIIVNGLISCIDGSQKNASGNLIDPVSNLTLTENGVTKLNTNEAWYRGNEVITFHKNVGSELPRCRRK